VKGVEEILVQARDTVDETERAELIDAVLKALEEVEYLVDTAYNATEYDALARVLEILGDLRRE